MAGKSRRVASRQSQLSRRRKKQQKGTTGSLPAVQVPADVDGTNAETSVAREAESSLAASAPTPDRPHRVTPPAAAPIQPAPAARTPRRVRSERSATYNYIGAEMRRILLLATAVLVIIVILGITI